ncbi:ABC transporter substrate-binding protein [Roseiterribacter gracilis]|uniref:ABC transporter permease n=1 Tax=Roseiterribacter gracilis TaxID=2812848 RepID=A0A8S8XAD0_9PROT|nr:ABC transporter permease [Rhodospirillales bacterium TMPK1]
MKKTMFAVALAATTALAMPALAQDKFSGGQVKIGILNDQSGPYADYGGKSSVEAAKIAIEEFGGKVAGKPIVLVDADHQNKPDVASNIARQWYDADGVDMIAELTTSSVALAVQSLSKEKNKIDMVVGAATSALTNDACTATGFHWAFDTYSLARGTGGALVKAGGNSWFFLTADYAFGHQLEKDTSNFVTEAGGKVLGAVRHPLNTADFSSFLLQAQASKAQVVGLANAGTDTTNAVKQAADFGIVKGGQKLAGLLFTLSEVHALGLEKAQGLVLTEAYYWDRDDKSREFAKKFMERTKRAPNMIQAGTYSAVRSYLKAVEAAGTDATDAVAAKLRELPVDDAFSKGKVAADGSFVHDMYLFEVKKPSESKAPWDYYKLLQTIPAAESFTPAAKSTCPLVKKS